MILQRRKYRLTHRWADRTANLDTFRRINHQPPNVPQEMKRRTFIKTSVAAIAASTVFKPFYIRAQSKKYRFGFSQVTTVEPWRVQFNKDMKKEADQHAEVELIITDGQDKTEKQVQDIENLIQ